MARSWIWRICSWLLYRCATFNHNTRSSTCHNNSMKHTGLDVDRTVHGFTRVVLHTNIYDSHRNSLRWENFHHHWKVAVSWLMGCYFPTGREHTVLQYVRSCVLQVCLNEEHSEFCSIIRADPAELCKSSRMHVVHTCHWRFAPTNCWRKKFFSPERMPQRRVCAGVRGFSRTDIEGINCRFVLSIWPAISNRWQHKRSDFKKWLMCMFSSRIEKYSVHVRIEPVQASGEFRLEQSCRTPNALALVVEKTLCVLFCSWFFDWKCGAIVRL